MTLEGDFSRKKVGPWLKTLPKSWFFRVELPYLRGIPDRIGVINGRFVALETKKSTKEAIKNTGRVVLQQKIINKISRCGGYAKFVYPENWEAIKVDLLNLSKGDLLCR